jgi:hypothetical protein
VWPEALFKSEKLKNSSVTVWNWGTTSLKFGPFSLGKNASIFHGRHVRADNTISDRLPQKYNI